MVVCMYVCICTRICFIYILVSEFLFFLLLLLLLLLLHTHTHTHTHVYLYFKKLFKRVLYVFETYLIRLNSFLCVLEFIIYILSRRALNLSLNIYICAISHIQSVCESLCMCSRNFIYIFLNVLLHERVYIYIYIYIYEIRYVKKSVF